MVIMNDIKIAKELLLLAKEITHQPIKFTIISSRKPTILIVG